METNILRISARCCAYMSSCSFCTPRPSPPPPSQTKLGASIPYDTPHALSVSLPTWKDNVGWATGDKCLVDAMSTGYPRFFVHRSIQRLVSECLKRLGVEEGEWNGMLFPTSRIANEGVSFITKYALHPATTTKLTPNAIRHVPILLGTDGRLRDGMELHLVIFPVGEWKIAKQFWQHAGMGISSRYADVCLGILGCEGLAFVTDPNLVDSWVPKREGCDEKVIVRKRIAELAAFGDLGTHCYQSSAKVVTEDDVYLYPTGMSAIWHAHQLVDGTQGKSVCFGFPYTDTLKVLEKWGAGCQFYSGHPDENLEALEAFLSSPSSSSPPITSLFCETPSNPLLQTPNLPRLRQLADQYGFVVVVDDTVGNWVNLDLMGCGVDVVVTSLSKAFGGRANVMGGSLVLNPAGPHYSRLKKVLEETYVDDYYPPDAVQMEINSRDFVERVKIINENTQVVARLLRGRSLSSPSPSSHPNSERFVIKDVFYPEWITRTNYDLIRRPSSSPHPNNFGPLLSLTFTSPLASHTFYDALSCCKGPSLGTNFTLVCPYTILAHYGEREWAAERGVEEGIVRFSVGMEEGGEVLGLVERAVEEAERICWEVGRGGV
ncbi:hypothetical protein JAAARDRAFT_534542 [Jaapia argillacea MUCL 33604]|uniref:Cystathionine gamma-synthase n=1 Tax=Jaapia argillacea MUCL 33604 TaxID=933084 RepID=A0A067PK74_9AGAM|nr:hypothetical protein JAAARDRAFT_534542 [Jaapia argillacea MUCL 33604]